MAVLYIYKHHALWVPQDSFNRLITDVMMLFKGSFYRPLNNPHNFKIHKCEGIISWKCHKIKYSHLMNDIKHSVRRATLWQFVSSKSKLGAICKVVELWQNSIMSCLVSWKATFFQSLWFEMIDWRSIWRKEKLSSLSLPKHPFWRGVLCMCTLVWVFSPLVKIWGMILVLPEF